MAVTSTVTKNSCSLKLDGGTNSSGKSVTYSSSLGALSLKATVDAVKTVADALSPCLSYATKAVVYTVTSSLTGSATS